MNLGELRALTLFQMGLDSEDEAELQPHLNSYLNEGYQMLCSVAGMEMPQDLRSDKQVPELPQWVHRALADWASYRLCMREGSGKQRRGELFYSAYRQARVRLANREGANFRNWE